MALKNQGCQIVPTHVCFHTKYPNAGMYMYFGVIRNGNLSVCIFYGHLVHTLVYFVVVWYVFAPFWHMYILYILYL
jgi:hypothetical protein